MDRVIHLLNETFPVAHHFIKNAVNICVHLYNIVKNSSADGSMLIPERLGLLTEIYLMMTSCLSTNSFLLSRNNPKRMSAADKLLLEIMYLQFFTLPLLSWKDIKPVVSTLLERTQITILFSYYF